MEYPPHLISLKVHNLIKAPAIAMLIRVALKFATIMK